MLCDIDIPDGYEFVRYGMAKKDDLYLSHVNRQVAVASGHVALSFIIVRKKFKLPDYIEKGIWYAKDKSGSEWLYSSEPLLRSEQWMGTTPIRLRRNFFKDFPEFVGDWKDSKVCQS